MGYVTQSIIYITVLHNSPQIVLESLTVAADLVFVAILIKMVCVIQIQINIYLHWDKLHNTFFILLFYTTIHKLF